MCTNRISVLEYDLKTQNGDQLEEISLKNKTVKIVLTNIFTENPEFRNELKINIAKCIYNNRGYLGRMGRKECGDVAEKIIKTMFEK